MPIDRIGNVFYRTHDIDASIRFYTEVLGFPLKLRDGDRWAAFDVGGMTLAVDGENASSTGAGGGATVSLRCTDLSSVVEGLQARGATVTPIETGPHERTAQLTDPSGNTLVLYEPLPRG